jgi:hypothetical protein
VRYLLRNEKWLKLESGSFKYACLAWQLQRHIITGPQVYMVQGKHPARSSAHSRPSVSSVSPSISLSLLRYFLVCGRNYCPALMQGAVTRMLGSCTNYKYGTTRQEHTGEFSPAIFLLQLHCCVLLLYDVLCRT